MVAASRISSLIWLVLACCFDERARGRPDQLPLACAWRTAGGVRFAGVEPERQLDRSACSSATYPRERTSLS